MDEILLENIERVIIVVADASIRISDALKAFNEVMVAKAVGIEQAREIWVDDKGDPIADLQRLLEEMRAHDKLAELADIAYLAEEPADIPPPRIIPRPPKRTGPVNKANHTANRPPRIARSNCRTIKR